MTRYIVMPASDVTDKILSLSTSLSFDDLRKIDNDLVLLETEHYKSEEFAPYPCYERWQIERLYPLSEPEYGLLERLLSKF